MICLHVTPHTTYFTSVASLICIVQLQVCFENVSNLLWVVCHISIMNYKLFITTRMWNHLLLSLLYMCTDHSTTLCHAYFSVHVIVINMSLIGMIHQSTPLITHGQAVGTLPLRLILLGNSLASTVPLLCMSQLPVLV